MAARRTIAKLLICFTFAILARPASAIFVLGYDFRFSQAGELTPEGPLREDEKYSVLVFMPDSQGEDYGFTDDLPQVLHQNHFPGKPAWANHYLKEVVAPWYFDQMRAEKRIYGDKVEAIIEGLSTRESILDGRSSVVVMTRYRNPFEPLAVLRVSVEDENGTLPSEGHFGVRAQRIQRDSVFRSFPVYSPTSHFNFLNIQYPVFDRVREVSESAAIELKNWSIGDEVTRKNFFVYTYFIARKHRLIFQASQRRFTSKVILDAYGKLLPRRYAGYGFVTFRELQNEKTHNLPLSFMETDIATLDARALQIQSSVLRQERKWLVPDPTLVKRLNTCPSYFKLDR